MSRPAAASGRATSLALRLCAVVGAGALLSNTFGFVAPAAAPRLASETTAASREAVVDKVQRRARGGGRYDAPADLQPPPTAEKSASGLAWQVLKAGVGGDAPGGDSVGVTVHYSGWRSSDGQLFDSSYLRNEPTEFKVGEVIPGWKEGLKLMSVGEKRRFWIPGKLAYGEEDPNAPPGGVPKGDLVFDVELLKIDDPGMSIITGFGSVFAVLLLGSLAYSVFNTPVERPEYDVVQPFSFKPL